METLLDLNVEYFSLKYILLILPLYLSTFSNRILLVIHNSIYTVQLVVTVVPQCSFLTQEMEMEVQPTVVSRLIPQGGKTEAE